MSPAAKSTLETAQVACATSRAAVAGLTARLDSGDATVTGNALTKANADLEVATRLLAAAEKAAAEESEEAQLLAAEGAVTDAVETHRQTSAELAEAIGSAVDAVERLVNVAADHRATTASKTSAVRGYGGHIGRLPTPSPEEIIAGVQVLAFQRVGIHLDHSYPHLLLEPLAPFLPAEV